MDLVTVTDTVLGLNKTAIRITTIDEDESGFLELTAEEFPLGFATATLYQPGNPSNTPLNRNVAVAAVNTPIIFEPPEGLVGATPQIWIAASGGAAGAADPNWGGYNVWLSVDNAHYTSVGFKVGPARQGLTTATLAAYSSTNPDTLDTLAVNLAESAGVLASGSSLDAQLGNTLCIVDGELISFQTATLTSANHYALTTIYRGLYGTTGASHASGAPFARLDAAIFKMNLPAQFINVALFIKLQSFNIFGGGLQDLSTCTAYSYVPSGVATEHPVATALEVASVMDFGLTTQAVGTQDDFGASLTLPVSIDVDLGLAQ
jgi:hypothetical protein